MLNSKNLRHFIKFSKNKVSQRISSDDQGMYRLELDSSSTGCEERASVNDAEIDAIVVIVVVVVRVRVAIKLFLVVVITPFRSSCSSSDSSSGSGRAGMSVSSVHSEYSPGGIPLPAPRCLRAPGSCNCAWE